MHQLGINPPDYFLPNKECKGIIKQRPLGQLGTIYTIIQ